MLYVMLYFLIEWRSQFSFSFTMLLILISILYGATVQSFTSLVLTYTYMISFHEKIHNICNECIP